PELGALDRRHGPLEPVRAGLDPRQRRVLVVDHQPGRQHPPGLRRAQVGPPGWAVALRSPHPQPPLPQGARGTQEKRVGESLLPASPSGRKGEGRPYSTSLTKWKGEGRGYGRDG